MIKKTLLCVVVLLLILLSADSFAGRVEGPGIIKANLKPDQEAVYALNVKSDNTISFVGIGQGGQVNYFLYDPNYKLIAYDLTTGSDCNISYFAKIPGKYYLEADNYGTTIAKLVIKTN
jgi:hypothetical protein